MLSDAVLAEIARPSPTQQMVVTAAWPSLSTESRLQVVAAVQGSGGFLGTPDWLLDLAMQDSAAIVRYWAARAAYYKEGEVDYSGKPLSPEDVKRARAARNDPSELVRLSVDRVRRGNFTSMSQQQRLIAIRNQDMASFSSFVDCISEGIEAKIPDEDLAACAEQFLADPRMIETMQEDDFDDGMTAHFEGKAMTEAWALLQGKAGPRLATRLASVLPVKRGLGTVNTEYLAAMPEWVLTTLVYRRGDHATFRELADLIRKEPDRFPSDVVRTLMRDDENYRSMPDEDARIEYRLKHALDRQASTIEGVLRIRSELGKLHERLDEVFEAATRKKGFFG